VQARLTLRTARSLTDWGFGAATTPATPATPAAPVYLPLSSQSPQQQQQQQQQQARAGDPWTRKDLFTLDLKPETAPGAAHGPGISPAAAAVARTGVHDYSSLRQVTGVPAAPAVAYGAPMAPVVPAYGGILAPVTVAPVAVAPVAYGAPATAYGASPYAALSSPASPYGAAAAMPVPSPYGNTTGASPMSGAGASGFNAYSGSSSNSRSGATTAASATLNWPANYGAR